jgi:choline dehydrogenase
MPMSSRDGARVTSLDAYLGVDPPNLTIRSESLVSSVTVSSGRATGVRLADGSTIAADRVILSAGTYGSPTILMRSGIGPADDLRRLGIPVEIDLPGVGANLADHPAVDLDTGWKGAGRSEPILHSIATYRSSLATLDGPPDLMFWVTDPEGEQGDFYLDPILLKPRSRGSVRLRSPDPLEPPSITLPNLEEPADIERLGEGYRRALEVANRPEIRQLTRQVAPTEPVDARELRKRVVENAYSVPHVVGTCAMGRSPDDGSVVDGLGRIHGIERLSVIDASVIPDAPSGFPHLITIMLAEHLASKANEF